MLCPCYLSGPPAQILSYFDPFARSEVTVLKFLFSFFGFWDTPSRAQGFLWTLCSGLTSGDQTHVYAREVLSPLYYLRVLFGFMLYFIWCGGEFTLQQYSSTQGLLG